MASNGHWVWLEYPPPPPPPATQPPAQHLDPHHQSPYYYDQHQQHPQTLPPSATPSYDYPFTSAAADVAVSSLSQPRLTANPYPPHGSYYEDAQSAQYYPYAAEALPAAGAVAASSSSSYYYGAAGGGATTLGFATTREVILEQVSVPLGYDVGLPRPTRLEHTIPGHSRPQQWKNKVLRLNAKLLKKRMKQLTKVVQSAYCEVCKIKCDTQEVLTIHKQGKKHKKKLQMLQASMTAKPTTAAVGNVGNTESSDVKKFIVSHEPSKKKDLPATAEELEAKKRRVLEGGASTDGVKVCTICNVVVNSSKVLLFHLAGQKHAAMVKRQQEQQAPSST